MSRTRDRRRLPDQTGMGAIHMGVSFGRCPFTFSHNVRCGFAGLAALTRHKAGIRLGENRSIYPRPRVAPGDAWTVEALDGGFFLSARNHGATQ